MKTICVATAVCLLTLGLAGVLAKEVDPSKLPPASNQQGLTFDKDIKSLFEKSCVKCHGAEKAKGRLRLDSREAILKGSEHGQVVIAGNSAKSTLVHAIARLNEDEAMPPKGKAPELTKEQVGLVRAWIDQGAK